jgi:anti-sigma B factor antagonist
VTTDQEHLQVEVRRQPDRIVMRLSGELDLASAPLFQRELRRAGVDAAPMIVLDLEGLEFIDSTGLRIILSARAGARERQQQFAITPGSPQVQRLLNMTRVAEHLRIIESPDEMLI